MSATAKEPINPAATPGKPKTAKDALAEQAKKPAATTSAPKPVKVKHAKAVTASDNPPKARKEKKPKKSKMIRDSFTMPETDYALIDALKKRCQKSGTHVKKSELLRVGLITLSRLNGPTLLKRVSQLEKIKPGRPPKG